MVGLLAGAVGAAIPALAQSEPAQPAASQPAAQPAQPPKPTTRIDRAKIRAEAKKYRKEEITFSENNGPKTPYDRTRFPPDF